MTVTATFTPAYLTSANGLVKYLQIGLAIVISIFASTPMCYEHFLGSQGTHCLSVFDKRSDVHGQAFVLVAAAVMAVETFLIFLARLFDVRKMHYDTNWRTVELFTNGIGFSIFSLLGALETWYACGYFEGTDYISPLNVKTSWIIAAACSFANALLHLLTMACVGMRTSKQ